MKILTKIINNIIKLLTKLNHLLESFTTKKTLNETILDLKDLNWDVVFNNVKLTMNAVPAASFALSYGLTVKAFHKFDSLYKCPPHLNEADRALFYRKKKQ